MQNECPPGNFPVEIDPTQLLQDSRHCPYSFTESQFANLSFYPRYSSKESPGFQGVWETIKVDWPCLDRVNARRLCAQPEIFAIVSKVTASNLPDASDPTSTAEEWLCIILSLLVHRGTCAHAVITAKPPEARNRHS